MQLVAAHAALGHKLSNKFGNLCPSPFTQQQVEQLVAQLVWQQVASVKALLAVPEIGVLVGVVNPNLGEEEVVRGRRWYHSKERC